MTHNLSCPRPVGLGQGHPIEVPNRFLNLNLLATLIPLFKKGVSVVRPIVFDLDV